MTFFFPFLKIKKKGENRGMECLTGEKVAVVKYSFLISEKTLGRKGRDEKVGGGMK